MLKYSLMSVSFWNIIDWFSCSFVIFTIFFMQVNIALTVLKFVLSVSDFFSDTGSTI